MKRVLLLCVIILTFNLINYDCFSAESTKKGRTLSLRKLEECLKKGNCPEKVNQLCGITKILGYVIDEKNSDVILFGEVNNTLPPLYLEDFVIALRNAWLKYAPLQGNTYMYSPPSCSIDPEPKVMNELHQVSKRIFNDSQPEQVQTSINEWNNVCEQPQKVRVMGIPFNTRFGKVMVDADYYMKRLVDGSVTLEIEGFKSLTDMTLDVIREDVAKNRQIYIPAHTMNRFWFYPGETNFIEDKGIVILKKCQVVLLTEEEFLTTKGKIAGSGRPDRLAKEFVGTFTAKYEDIAGERPIYHQLEGLFRFTALSKLMKGKDAFSEAHFTPEYLLNRFPIKETSVDPFLPGISNVKEFQHKSEYHGGYSILNFWLPSCGGVFDEL